MPVKTEKRPRSLRRLVFILTGASLTVFSFVLFSIFHTAMPDMLLRAEDMYLDKQHDVVTGLFRIATRNTFVMADDISSGDEITAFVEGKNPGFMKKQWPDMSPLESYRYTFLIIKDADGKDLHIEFFDYESGTLLPVPRNFSSILTPLAKEVMDAHTPSANPGKHPQSRGRGGIIFHNEVPYFLAAMPVTATRAQGKASGAVILGSILDNDYFRNMTQYRTIVFQMLSPREVPGTSELLSRTSEDMVTMGVRLATMDGEPCMLLMSAMRAIYAEGKSTLNNATIMLIAVMILFALTFYSIIVRRFLRPVETISRDIASVSAADILIPDKYSACEEFTNLCTSINEMMQRLHQSNISLDVLQRILSGTDIFLYVSDFATDEILFINDNMRRHFNLDESVVGKTCWRVFQKDLTQRCSFCPALKLEKNPEQPVIWEERSSITGKYYRNTGSLIEWTDGRLAHLQHRVEISDIKNAEAALKKRLEQQELMSAMSRSFISSGDMNSFIRNALHMSGEFMDASRMLLAAYNAECGELTFAHEWTNPRQEIQQLRGISVPFRNGTPIHDALMAGQEPYVAYTEIAGIPELARFAESGVIGFIDVPIFVEGVFWGVLGIDECAKPRQWTASDIQLMTLIGSVISGGISRSEIEKKLERMSSIVKSSPGFIAYITPDGKYEYINEGAKALLGYTAEEIIKGGMPLIFSPEALQRVREDLLPRTAKEGKIEFESEMVRKDGQKRLFSFHGFTANRISGGIGSIAYDITEQRRLELDVLASKEQAESSSKAKGEFLSRMSHEIRTPLNAIIGMTGIAKSSRELERKEYCLEKIESASSHLLGVINDILDMSKIEANKFELSYTEFIFEKMLIRTTNVINFRVEEKDQNLIVNLDRNIPAALISDEQRLAQVIANLLSNAVKFTPEKGTITLKATLLSEEEDYCTLRIDVTDTGIGISRENQGKLFSSFEQADGGIARKFGGTGLGLAISKSIVEMMGGAIWVTSEEGKGSTFSFTMRARRGEDAHEPLLAPDVNWENLRVLAVDDAPEVRDFFREFADVIGLSCDVASDGEEASALLESTMGQPYNIIFVDWKMPGMNGIELTRHIKSAFGVDTVVILISALQWNMVEKEAREVGVDKFIPKPLFTSIIVDCINQCLDSREKIASDVARSAFTDGCFEGRRILLVEDIDVNREIVISLLENTRVDIDTAENGRVAHEMVRDNPGLYDMIFMDIHMPEVDGYEATRRIRAIDDERARNVPIIAMTANVFREDIEKCLAAGMNDHVGKPIDMEEMLHKLALYLECGTGET